VRGASPCRVSAVYVRWCKRGVVCAVRMQCACGGRAVCTPAHLAAQIAMPRGDQQPLRCHALLAEPHHSGPPPTRRLYRARRARRREPRARGAPTPAGLDGARTFKPPGLLLLVSPEQLARVPPPRRLGLRRPPPRVPLQQDGRAQACQPAVRLLPSPRRLQLHARPAPLCGVRAPDTLRHGGAAALRALYPQHCAHAAGKHAHLAHRDLLHLGRMGRSVRKYRVHCPLWGVGVISVSLYHICEASAPPAGAGAPLAACPPPRTPSPAA
jgi:hypothetical protein